MDSTAGRLLVASPLIGDPNFERSVILMLEHSDDGALGLVLNNPSQMPLDEMLPQWTPLVSAPSTFFFGGPVSPSSVIALGRVVGSPPADFKPVIGSVGPIDLHDDPTELAYALDQARAFAGYSGWGPRQLESELAVDAWFVVDADPHDAFTTDPHGLWSFVLKRQSGPMSWLANYPEDPRMN